MFKVLIMLVQMSVGFPGGSDSKESACNAEDLGLIPGSGRTPWRREWPQISHEANLDLGSHVEGNSGNFRNFSSAWVT